LEGSHAQPELIRFLRVLASETSGGSAARAAYDRYLSTYPASERSSFLDELAPLLDDRAALRVRIRKIAAERGSGLGLSHFIADAVGEPEAAIAALRVFLDEPGNDDFRKYWQPWIIPYSKVRTLPQFKALLREAGIVDYWRKTGKWGDFCKPVGA